MHDVGCGGDVDGVDLVGLRLILRGGGGAVLHSCPLDNCAACTYITALGQEQKQIKIFTLI